MTDRPSEQTPPSEPRTIDMVAVLAIVLCAVIFAVIAWLVLSSESEAPNRGGASVSLALPPAASIALPPASQSAAAPPGPEPTETTAAASGTAPSNPSGATAGATPAPTGDAQAPAGDAQARAGDKEPAIGAPPALPESVAQIPPSSTMPPQGDGTALPPVPPIAPPAAAAPNDPQMVGPSVSLPVARGPSESRTPTTIPPPPESMPEPTAAPEAPDLAAAPRGAIPSPPNYQPAQRASLAPIDDGLATAPDPALVEQGRDGPLPAIGKDGRKPWQVYARPFDSRDSRPRVGLIIGGLGPSAAATEAAIQRLPGPITLAFVAYAKNLDHWMALSRDAGHETLLALPMEPISSDTEPGPHTLLTSLSERDNRARLLFLLSRASGYVGVLNSMGGRLTTSPQSLRPILAEIRDRGLVFVDARSSQRSIAASQASEIGLPRAINNGFIDLKAARADIDAQLENLSQLARDSGYALGIASSYPVTIERVALWADALDGKGITLAPITALVDKQPD